MKRVFVVLGLLVFANAMIFGGGGSQANQAKKTELIFIESGLSAGRTQIIKDLIAQYEKLHPNIKINLVVPPYDQSPMRKLLELQAGNPLDIVEGGHGEMLPGVPNGWFVDLTPYFEQWEDAKTLLPSAMVSATYYFGKPYYIPWGLQGASKSLFVRTDVTAKAGITRDPASMQELYEFCVQITNPAANQYGFALRGKGAPVYHYPAWTLHEVPNIDPNNQHFLKDGTSVYATPEFLAALKRYVDLYHKGAPPDSVNWGFNEQLNGFVSGVTPYLMQDPDAIPTIAEYLTPDQFKVIPIPLGNAKTLLGYAMAFGGLALPTVSKHKEEAWEFMKWICAPAQNAVYAKASGFLPLHSVTYENDSYFGSGLYKSWADIVTIPGYVTYVKDDPRVELVNDWAQRHEADLQAVLLGQKTPEEVCAGWAEYWKR
jgi:multiple sugar transport system substrate-binding protein